MANIYWSLNAGSYMPSTVLSLLIYNIIVNPHKSPHLSKESKFDVNLTLLLMLHILILTVIMKSKAYFPINEKSVRKYLLWTKME